MARRTLTDQQKQGVIDRDKGKCHLCGDPVFLDGDFEADHEWPIAKHGPDTMENLRASHHDCNQAKGDRFIFDPDLPRLINAAVDKRRARDGVLRPGATCGDCGCDISHRKQAFYCKPCAKERDLESHRQFKKRNAERIQAYGQEYEQRPEVRERRNERNRERAKDIRENNPELHQEQLAKRREKRATPEERKKASTAWKDYYERNKARLQEKTRKLRADPVENARQNALRRWRRAVAKAGPNQTSFLE